MTPTGIWTGNLPILIATPQTTSLNALAFFNVRGKRSRKPRWRISYLTCRQAICNYNETYFAIHVFWGFSTFLKALGEYYLNDKHAISLTFWGFKMLVELWLKNKESHWWLNCDKIVRKKKWKTPLNSEYSNQSRYQFQLQLTILAFWTKFA